MRSMSLFIWLLCFIGVVLAQASSVEHIPACAQPCLLEGFNRTSCPTTSQPCLCHDGNFMNFLEDCVVNHCLPNDALATQNYTWTACGFPVENDFVSTRAPRLAMFFVLPTLSIVMRMVVKFARVSAWGADDLLILIAYAFLVAFVPMNALAGKTGAGQDMWFLTADQITNYFMNFYILQALYHWTISLLKASILFMFLRIFPNEWFRVALWGTQAFNLIVGVTFVLLGLFQCHPVRLAWTVWRHDAESQGACMDIMLITIAHSAIQVGLDIWMLILPLTQIIGLNMKWKKKLGMVFMFSLGLFLTAISIIRLRLLINYHQGTHNFTVDSIPICIWSDIELCVGFFTACIPSIRQFLRVFIFRRPDGAASLHSEHIHGRTAEGTRKRPTRLTADAVDEMS